MRRALALVLCACNVTAASSGKSPTPDAGDDSQSPAADASAGTTDGDAAEADAGPDAAADDAGPESSGPISVQLPIPPRVQWNNADGYCGEVSIQSIALYYGSWVCEGLVRTIAGGELLIGVNATQALTALHFDYAEWDNSGQTPQFQAFLLWVKTYLLQGSPSLFGAYLTDGKNDPDYDHVMPATGIVTATPGAYDGNDVLTWNDNFGDQISRAGSMISATRASCSYSSTQGGCIPLNVDYGVAVTGVVDPRHVTLPVSLSVAQSSEPNISLGDQAVSLTGTVVVSGLTPGGNYALLRYDDYTQVPTDASAADYLASGPTYRVDFTAAGSTWTYHDPNAFTSSGSATYRCVGR